MKKVERPFYLNSLKDARENSMVKVITGIRRCGKSFLLNELFYDYLIADGISERQITKVNLEESKNRPLLEPDALAGFIKRQLDPKKMNYIFIDEVQQADGFEATLSELSNLANTDIYVTGSNSRFLSSDIITEFRGRGDEIQVRPFNFAEYLEASGLERSVALREYLIFGGMPLSLSFSTEERKSAYLKGLFQEVYFADIKERYSLENDAELSSVVDALASSVGSLTNPHRLAQYFESNGIKGITESEIKKYLFYLTDAFLLSKVDRYDIKGKKYLSTPSKYYYEDVGLRNARLNFRQQEVGHLMENLIYNELRVRGLNVDVGIVGANITENGKNTRKQYEVDFVCNQVDRRYYIQSAATIPDAEKLEQETNSLRRIDDSFKKIVVVRDDIRPYHNEEGILFAGIIDFLLTPEVLTEF